MLIKTPDTTTKGVSLSERIIHTNVSVSIAKNPRLICLIKLLNAGIFVGIIPLIAYAAIISHGFGNFKGENIRARNLAFQT